MATTKELVTVANAAAQGITDLGTAINALEAKITEALAKIPSIPVEAQNDIDAAVATLQKAATDAAAAVADAADGVDEASLVVPTTP